MASTVNLRSRRSAGQLHALAEVEREIRAQDSHSRRKYLREFSQAFRSYDSLLDCQQVQNALYPADVVLIGDYHALPATQRYAASLIEQRAMIGDRRVVLGVETIFARDQHILEEWWRREIDESELRQRIRFDLDWGYDWARSTNCWSLPATTAKPSTASIACLGKTCARSVPAIVTPPPSLPKSTSSIPMQ
jgi:hypothetical protein